MDRGKILSWGQSYKDIKLFYSDVFFLERLYNFFKFCCYWVLSVKVFGFVGNIFNLNYYNNLE